MTRLSQQYHCSAISQTEVTATLKEEMSPLPRLNLRFSSVQGNRLAVQLLNVVFVLVDCTYGLEPESRANTALSVSQRVLTRRSYALTAGLHRLRRLTQRW